MTTLPVQSTLKVHGGYRLVQMRMRGRHTLGLARLQGTEPLPIAASRHPLEGDIGPARSGGLPYIVYSRCSDARRRRCSLWLYHRLRDSEPRRLGQSGTAPTVWRDRVAWVRDGAVWTRRIGSRRSRLVAPAAPGVSVEELELFGDHLAMSLRKRHGTTSVIEVRLDGRFVASRPAGEAGQRYRGLSFAAGRLGWNLSCLWAPSCGTAYRYGLRTRTIERTKTANLSGFAITHYGYAAVDPRGDVSPNRPCERPCRLLEVRSVRWAG